MYSEQTPAYQLTGRILPNGWKVNERVRQPAGISSGKNSVCYYVTSNGGEKAFLKAFDYLSHMQYASAVDSIYEATRNYRYERGLLQTCLNEELSLIAKIVDHGGIHLGEDDRSSLVQYLIIERADCDVRPFVGHVQNSRMSRILSMMHQATVATQQLHSINVAHQDIKPGNVLIFGRTVVKLGDLGRATQFKNPSPYDHYLVAGDPEYSPPELLYRELPNDWETRRLGCDFYMLGNLIYFMSTGASLNAMLREKLDQNLWYDRCSDSYDKVFPAVQSCFLQCIDELRATTHPSIASDVASLVKQLCNPSPEERGLPMNRGYNRFSLRRFVSRLDLLHKKNGLAPWHNDPISKRA